MPVTLSLLAEPAAQDLREQNHQAVTLAQAGLWLAALDLLEQTLAHEPKEEVAWNAALIRLHAQNRREALNQLYDGNRLLRSIFAGDFAGAVERIMLLYPADQIFSEQSPLIAGTVLETPRSVAAQQMDDRIETMLTVFPASLHAYFLRAWVGYLLDPQDAAILADVQRAFALNPEQTLIADSYAYLRGDVGRPSEAQVTARTILNVRSGPGTDYSVIGQLALDESAQAVSKVTQGSDGGLWWQIIYPPNSADHGWVSGRQELIYTRHVESIPDVTPELALP